MPMKILIVEDDMLLADRIFCLHEMKLSVENLSDGVQIRVIWKKQEA